MAFFFSTAMVPVRKTEFSALKVAVPAKLEASFGTARVRVVPPTLNDSLTSVPVVFLVAANVPVRATPVIPVTPALPEASMAQVPLGLMTATRLPLVNWMPLSSAVVTVPRLLPTNPVMPLAASSNRLVGDVPVDSAVKLPVRSAMGVPRVV